MKVINGIELSEVLDVDVSEEASGSSLVFNSTTGKWEAVKNNLAAAVAPDADNDSTEGYSVGSLWFDLTASPHEIYRCMDATESTAVWVNSSLEVGELGALALLDEVALSNMASMATDSFIGRTTDETGVPEILSKTQALAILNVEDGAEANAASDHTRSHSITGTSDHSDTADFIDGPLSPGVLTGGIISEGTEGTVTVSAITALLRTDTATTDPLVKVTLAEQANKAIGSADTVYHVGLDYNSGDPQILVQTGNFNRTTEIGLGTCMKDTSTPVKVHFSNAGQRNQDGVNKLQRRASSLRRTELASGCGIADIGGATRQFSIQSGIVYHGIYRMTPFAAAPYNPYISGDDGYFLVYGDTDTGFTISDGTDTVINNTQYWNTATHALGTVTTNQFACHWVYIHTDDEDVYVVLGDGSYKLAEAEQAQPLTDLPIEISEFGLLLGCIIIERDATAFEIIQMVTDTFFTGNAVANHASLSNLDYASAGHTGFQPALFDETVQASSDTLSVGEVSGKVINNYGQAAGDNLQTLPTAAEGMSFVGLCGTAQAAHYYGFQADTDDKIYLDGTAGSDNGIVKIAAPVVGAKIVFHTFQTGATTFDWIATTVYGTWVTG